MIQLPCEVNLDYAFQLCFLSEFNTLIENGLTLRGILACIQWALRRKTEFQKHPKEDPHILHGKG